MQSNRELTAVYAILGQAHVAAEIYDPKGAFVLLNSIAAGLGDATPRFIDVVSHAHMVAALGDNPVANREARLSMAHLIGILEQRLTWRASATAEERLS